jgi:hypothetical protein
MVNIGYQKDGRDRRHFYLGGRLDVGMNELPLGEELAPGDQIDFMRPMQYWM